VRARPVEPRESELADAEDTAEFIILRRDLLPGTMRPWVLSNEKT
jgi:hypothetical protein